MENKKNYFMFTSVFNLEENIILKCYFNIIAPIYIFETIFNNENDLDKILSSAYK